MMTHPDETIANLTFAKPSAGQFKIAIVGLNNLRALKAVKLAIFQALERELLEWRERADIVCVVLHG